VSSPQETRKKKQREEELPALVGGGLRNVHLTDKEVTDEGTSKEREDPFSFQGGLAYRHRKKPRQETDKRAGLWHSPTGIGALENAELQGVFLMPGKSELEISQTALEEES